MKRVFLLFNLLLIFNLFSQEDKRLSFNERIYDPFFSCSITDNEGITFNISNFYFMDEYGDKNFFFWVRRNSGLYQISFKNIKKVEISQDDLADSRYIGYTKSLLTLMNGESYEVYIKSMGQLEGVDEEFASPVSFYLHYNLIREINFFHDGEYSFCPFCETIYFSKEIETCIYDKTPLEKGVLSSSEISD